MPLYIGDYARDTTHLTCVEHGAYLLLLMAMWNGGGKLPSDDIRLSKLTRLTVDQWRDIKPTIMEYFTKRGGTMTQKRLSKEYKKYDAKFVAQSKAGKATADKKRNKNKEKQPSLASEKTQLSYHNQNHIELSKDNSTEGGDFEKGYAW